MKKLLTLISIMLTLIACNNSGDKTTAISENQKVIIQYFDHFNKHEWEEMANLYSETAEFKDPSLGNGIIVQTRQDIIDKYSELNGIFPDIQDQLIQIYPSGEKHIIVEFVSTGTAADNSKFELPVCTVFTIENGLITKDFSYFDNFEEEY